MEFNLNKLKVLAEQVNNTITSTLDYRSKDEEKIIHQFEDSHNKPNITNFEETATTDSAILANQSESVIDDRCSIQATNYIGDYNYIQCHEFERLRLSDNCYVGEGTNIINPNTHPSFTIALETSHNSLKTIYFHCFPIGRLSHSMCMTLELKMKMVEQLIIEDIVNKICLYYKENYLIHPLPSIVKCDLITKYSKIRRNNTLNQYINAEEKTAKIDSEKILIRLIEELNKELDSKNVKYSKQELNELTSKMEITYYVFTKDRNDVIFTYNIK